MVGATSNCLKTVLSTGGSSGAVNRSTIVDTVTGAIVGVIFMGLFNIRNTAVTATLSDFLVFTVQTDRARSILPGGDVFASFFI